MLANILCFILGGAVGLLAMACCVVAKEPIRTFTCPNCGERMEVRYDFVNKESEYTRGYERGAARVAELEAGLANARSECQHLDYVNEKLRESLQDKLWNCEECVYRIQYIERGE